MMNNKFDVAVVGAASLAGEAVLALLAERKFPLAKLFAVDRVAQTASHVEYKDEPLVIHELADFDFEQVQLAIFLTDTLLAAEYVPRAAEAGCIAIDTSPCFRYEADVPLVIPGINDHLIADYRVRMIVANPSSATSQLIKSIKPIYDAVGIDSLNVTVLLSVSQMGKPGQEELGKQTARLLNFQDAEKEVFSQQIAFNVIPECGVALSEGYTTDELDLIKGAQKVLSNDKISIMATAVIVPVFFAHGEVISMKTSVPVGADKVIELLDNVPGLQLTKGTSNTGPSPVADASGKESIAIGRIRAGLGEDGQDLCFWSVADNIRSGIALNSVQTAEILVKDYLQAIVTKNL